ncbi:hypothetical protein Mapa_014291 [Marchantia paleacea]|nr:hypothetical protein Mapa_014291 [Marchantia paleacea]
MSTVIGPIGRSVRAHNFLEFFSRPTASLCTTMQLSCQPAVDKDPVQGGFKQTNAKVTGGPCFGGRTNRILHEIIGCLNLRICGIAELVSPGKAIADDGVENFSCLFLVDDTQSV